MQNYLTTIRDYTTSELVAELRKRQGVNEMTVTPYSECRITIDENWEGNEDNCEFDGSAIVLVVID